MSEEVPVFEPPSGVESFVEDMSVTLSWLTPDKLYPFENAGAESGNVGGVSTGPPVAWTVTQGSLRVRTDAAREPPEGSSIFDGGTSATSRGYQRFSPLAEGLTIAQIDNDGLTLTVDWYGGAFFQTPIDRVQLHVHFRDGDGVLISTHSSGYKSTSTPVVGLMVWNPYQETPTIPVGTRFVDIEMECLRMNGTNNDAAFDDFELTLEDAEPLPFLPGYAVYIDDVLVGTTAANTNELLVEGMYPGTYVAKIRVYDGTNFLSDYSEEVEFTINEPVSPPDPEQIMQVVGFTDADSFPLLSLLPRINQRDAVCGRRPGAVKKPPRGAMLRSVCSKVKP